MNRNRPLVLALVSCAVLVIGGLVGITVGYVMVARTLDAFDQVPLMVSGGLGGLGLVIAGCGFGYVQVSRACAEQERAQESKLLGRIGSLADLERRRIAAGDATAPKQRTPRSAKKQSAAKRSTT